MFNERTLENDFPYRDAKVELASWMSSPPALDSLSIAELVLPGAHNAGVDQKASYVVAPAAHWAACQTGSFYYQMNHGARALDVRLECETRRNGMTEFWFQHSNWRSSRVLENLIMDVIRFLQENPDEFIVLDFHQLSNNGERFNYKEFNRMMVTHLGERIIQREHAHLTLGELKLASRHRRVMVAAEYHPDFDMRYFCDQIRHEWSGIDDTNIDELKAHITRVMKYPPSVDRPWSLSATSYNKGWGPVSIETSIDQWFDPAKTGWALNSSIINVDFFERSNLVMHCWKANILKVKSRDR
jgi:1-phosphatidylinositol phosphodiesterase